MSRGSQLRKMGDRVCKRPSRVDGPQRTRKSNPRGVNARFNLLGKYEVHVVKEDAAGRRYSRTHWEI